MHKKHKKNLIFTSSTVVTLFKSAYIFEKCTLILSIFSSQPHLNRAATVSSYSLALDTKTNHIGLSLELSSCSKSLQKQQI